MADPCVDLTAEHGAVLIVDPNAVTEFTCDKEGSDAMPCRVFIVLSSGGKKQVGQAATEGEAADIVAAVRLKLYP